MQLQEEFNVLWLFIDLTKKDSWTIKENIFVPYRKDNVIDLEVKNNIYLLII